MPTYLISIIQKLEKEYDIKFSYVDEDIQSVQVRVAKELDLTAILAQIESQTQIKIQKLNERYYTLARPSLIDICGIVLDNFEKNTVMGATVEALGSGNAVITDMDGSFSMKRIPWNTKLQIKFLGFRTLFVEASELVGNAPCRTLLLAQFYQQLDEVVVYKFLTTGLSKQSDASIQLKTAEFGILPGTIEPDILQTVQALPGIKSIDETVSDINIRGGSNDQNLLLWEGIKMYQSGHFFGLISAFNPYLTDNVILIKNGSSAQYGDGVSGIIDMRTPNELEEDFFGGAGLNLISGDLYGQVPLGDKIGFQFSARRAMTDFFNTPTYDQFFKRAFQDIQVTNDNNQVIDVEKNADFYFYDFTGKLLYDIDAKHKARLNLINMNNNLDYTARDPSTNNSSSSTLNQSNFSIGGSLESKWTGKFYSHLSAYYSKYDLDARNTSADAQQSLFQKNQVLEKALKFNTILTIQKGLQWLNGYQLTETGITNATDVFQPPYLSNIKGIVLSHGLYSEVEYTSPDQHLFARGGLRLNYLYNREGFDKGILEPRMNVNYIFSKGWKAFAMGEFKSQTTNQIVDLEQNFLGIEKRRWIISDGDILPITRSKQGSIGVNYDREKLYIGLEGFFKEVKGISTTTQGFQNQNQFNGEIGKYVVKGLELLINKKTDVLSIWGSYTYNLNNYTFTDIVPREFPNNFDIRHSFTLAATYTAGKFRLGVGLNYRSGKPYTEPLEDDPLDTTFFPYRINYNAPNSSRLPEYLRADASAIYDFKLAPNIKASIGASVLNFSAKKNIFNTYYRLGANDEIEKVESVSLGLTPNFSFRVDF
tara:strand:- start:5964 stop:8426 length:2463 start_codon:yes stop_codon:yes gene_type:complete